MFRSKRSGRKPKNIYELDEVTAMLPLLKSICRSVESNSALMASLTLNEDGDDQDDIDWELSCKAERHHSLKEEVAQLRGRICHARRGFIDIPVWHPHLAEVVHVCVNSNSEAGELKAHLTTQKSRHRKFFWSL